MQRFFFVYLNTKLLGSSVLGQQKSLQNSFTCNFLFLQNIAIIIFTFSAFSRYLYPKLLAITTGRNFEQVRFKDLAQRSLMVCTASSSESTVQPSVVVVCSLWLLQLELSYQLQRRFIHLPVDYWIVWVHLYCIF